MYEINQAIYQQKKPTLSKFFSVKSEPKITSSVTENVSSILNKEVDLVKNTPVLSNPDIKDNEPNDFLPKDSVVKKTSKKTKSSPKKSTKTKEVDNDISENTIANFTDLDPVRLEGLDMESKLYEALKKYYNYDRFKSDTQKKAVFEISKREGDVYVSMPTGKCQQDII